MKPFLSGFCLAALFLTICTPVRAGFFDKLKSAITLTNSTASVAGLSLPEDQIVDGLKEALGKGVEHAVSSLGHMDGFMTNLNVKIPMPSNLQTVEKGLRLAGQGQMADDFIASMNHAECI